MEFKNRNPLIVCICGRAFSGKSFAGEIIGDFCVKKNLQVVVSPYTKYLKMYISQITEWDMSEVNKPRDLLQKLSSELIKEKLDNKDFFVNRQLEDIDFYSYFFDVIIIPDVRFPREIEVLKERYSRVFSVGIIRDCCDSNLSLEQKNDVTEVALDDYSDYDYVIFNDGTDNFKSAVLDVFKNIEMRDFNE